MTEERLKELTRLHRSWMVWGEEEFDSDQDLKKPQPPLTKEAGPDHDIIALPKNFQDLPRKQDLLRLFYERRSNRVFTKENIDLLTLSYLCYAQQGVKSIRGKNYATLRTAPSGGARHAFELYMVVLHCDDLKPGLYHYLSMTHELEFLREIDVDDEEEKKAVSESLCGQDWALKASVIFYYSVVYYRAEWRYGCDAHRVVLIDAGHAVENLYLAATSLSLGTCAIAALDSKIADQLFQLDGMEETMFYAAPLGTVNVSDEADEQAFYAFLNEE